MIKKSQYQIQISCLTSLSSYDVPRAIAWNLLLKYEFRLPSCQRYVSKSLYLSLSEMFDLGGWAYEKALITSYY